MFQRIQLVPRQVVTLPSIRLDLRYTLAAVYRLETVLGRPLRVDSSGSIPMEDFRALVWSMHEGRETLFEVGNSIHGKHLSTVIDAVSRLMRLSTVKVVVSDRVNAKQTSNKMDWMDLWSIAKIDMRLSNEEFWSLTPHMYYSLLERLKRKYGAEPELSDKERAESILQKVAQINAGMGGKDLREVAE